jgi:hypothetical protein
LFGALGKEGLLKMTFDEYVAAITALAAKDNALDSTGKYCDPDAWRDFYEDGSSPEEAWAEEKSYWSY